MTRTKKTPPPIRAKPARRARGRLPGHWPLQDAKARFSELAVRVARGRERRKAGPTRRARGRLGGYDAVHWLFVITGLAFAPVPDHAASAKIIGEAHFDDEFWLDRSAMGPQDFATSLQGH